MIVSDLDVIDLRFIIKLFPTSQRLATVSTHARDKHSLDDRIDKKMPTLEFDQFGEDFETGASVSQAEAQEYASRWPKPSPAWLCILSRLPGFSAA